MALKKNSNRSQIYDHLVTSQDALSLNYRRLVGAKTTKLPVGSRDKYSAYCWDWTVDMSLCAMIEM